MAKRFIDFYRDAVLNKGSGGGSEPTLIDKNISANGTYNASSDNADGYKKVVVSVPNSYTASDEGKVVKNGALASQSNATYTQNDTYDTTDIKQVTVNVSGGSPTLQSKFYSDINGDLFQTAGLTALPDQGYDGLDQVEVTVDSIAVSLTAIGKWLDTMSGEYMPEWGDYLGAFLTVPLGLFSKYDEMQYDYVGRDDILVYKLPGTTEIAENAFRNVGFDKNDACTLAPPIPLMFELDNVESIGARAFDGLKGHSVMDPWDGVPKDLVAIRITQSDSVCAIESDTFSMQSGMSPTPIKVVVPDSMVSSYEVATNWADAIAYDYVTIMGESDPDNPWNNI